MIDQLLIFAAVIAIPFPIGYGLATWRPHSRTIRNAIVAALPVSLPFFLWAAWITATQVIGCEAAGCNDDALLWAMALYVIGVLTGITGFGVGLIGDTVARNRAKKSGE